MPPVIAVVPVLRSGEDATMRRVAKRFGIGSLVALTILIATGLAMAEHLSRWGSDTLNVNRVALPPWSSHRFACRDTEHPRRIAGRLRLLAAHRLAGRRAQSLTQTANG